jgi:adenylylsulfate kinase
MSPQQGFAVWLTGLPASGKSSIARELVKMLAEHRVPVVVLESDRMREILTPGATYAPGERDWFYEALALLAEHITRNRVNVIIDATANRRAYRDRARALIPVFIEAYVKCPLEVCMQRDPKGIYNAAASGKTATVPGLQASYEEPLAPELTLDCRAPAAASARAVLDKLGQLRRV